MTHSVPEDALKQAEIVALIKESFVLGINTLGEVLPLYANLQDSIKLLIESGKLAYECRLPTISELARALNLAKGTVSHAYKDLEKAGYLSLTQGRGSFVSWQPDERTVDPPTRIEQAMLAIDKMLKELEKLEFTPREMQIYVDLKMREFYETQTDARLAIVAKTIEERSVLSKEIDNYENVYFTAFSLEDLLKQQIKVEDFQVFVVSEEVYPGAKLRLQLKPQQKLIPVVLQPAVRSLIELSQLPADARVGVLALSEQFASRVLEDLVEYAHLKVPAMLKLLHEQDLDKLLAKCDYLVFPYACFIYLRDSEREAINNFVNKGGNLLDYKLTPEKASVLSIRRCLEELAQYGKEHI